MNGFLELLALPARAGSAASLSTLLLLLKIFIAGVLNQGLVSVLLVHKLL